MRVFTKLITKTVLPKRVNMLRNIRSGRNLRISGNLWKKMSLYIQFNLLGFFGGTRDSNQSQFQHYLQHSPTLLPPLPFRSISHEMTIPLTTFMIMKVSHWKNFRNKGKWVQWSMTLQWASHGLSSRVIRIETENVWILVASRDWVRTKRACFFERLKDHRLQPWISN